MNEILNKLKQERRAIGRIIDDRSMYRIPFFAYVAEYEKLTAEINKEATQ